MKFLALLIAMQQLKFMCGLITVNLSIAFENVTRHLFELETRMFIENYDVDMDDMTSLFLNSLNERAMPFQLSNKRLDNKVLMDSSALVTFKSFDKLRTFNHKLAFTNKFYKPLQLFLFCQGASVSEIKKLAGDVAQRHRNSRRPYRIQIDGVTLLREITMADEKTALTDVINYEYFLITESQFVRLLTFVWYSQNKCGELQLIEVNRFNIETSKWKNNKFLIDKLANFHGCEIVHEFVVHDRSSLFHLYMAYELEANLNYKLRSYKIGNLIDFYFHKACYDSHDYMESFENIVNPTTGKTKRTKIDVFIAWPVNYVETWLAVPPTGNYSEYEKLAMPFDIYTWALIALTFVIAFTTILILYCVPTTIRDFVIGLNVTTPSLNILQIFFGIALSSLPRRNFARFLTMLFILYCLIVRTAWQGKMFEFMTKDVAKPEIQTIEEAIQGGYKFYMEPNFKQMYPESEIGKRGKIQPNERTIQLLFSKNETGRSLLDPSFKGVLQVDPYVAAFLISKTEGRFSKRFRKEVVTSKMCGFAFMAHHHFTGIFDIKSQQLFTAGIVHFRKGRNLKHEIVLMEYKGKFKISPEPPQVLNLTRLEPGFVIFSSCLLFSIFVFLLELLTGICKLFMLKKAAGLAMSVVPEIENVATDSIKNLVLDYVVEQMTSENVEVAIEEDSVVNMTDERKTREEAEVAKEALDAEASTVTPIERRDSIDALIETFEIHTEAVEGKRIVVQNRSLNRKDSTDELLDDFEIATELFKKKLITENHANLIEETIDDLLQDSELHTKT